jgi:hypothetical protein
MKDVLTELLKMRSQLNGDAGDLDLIVEDDREYYDDGHVVSSSQVLNQFRFTPVYAE